MDFSVGEFSYQSTKMDAMLQLHVMRKLAPVLTAVGSLAAVASFMGGDQDGGKAKEALQAVTHALAEMPDGDLEAIVGRCMSVVSRKIGEAGYMPAWNAVAKRPQFADIDWITMLQIVANVIQDNLGNFSPAPASK